MENQKIRVGFAMTGSYCTFDEVLKALAALAGDGRFDLYPVMSERAYSTSTRFGTAESFVKRVTELTGREPIHDILGAEPIGPKKLFDVMIVAPCTGNTIAKLAYGITDSSVTMAVKANLRNGKPVILAVSTNDALSTAARNIGELLARRNIYFVPYRQDDFVKKPQSMVALMHLIPETLDAVLEGRQLMPLIRPAEGG